MQRKKYLLKNTALFALNSIGTRLITFLLVPVYTAALTTSDYGAADLVSTIATILVPILTLNIGEAVMRFSLDDNADYDRIMSVGISVGVISSLVSLVIFPITKAFPSVADYSLFITLYCISQGVYHIVVCYLRGTEQLVHFAITNIVHVFSTAIFNIVFLIVLKRGLEGYFVSYLLGYSVGIVYAVFFGRVYRVFYRFKPDYTLAKQMAKYSIVLVPTSFMWWIMNSSDRIMVTAMVGIAANGIYAISYKVPTIVSALSTVFNQAWSYSAIKEDKSSDREEFNNRAFNAFVNFQAIITGGLLMIIKPFLSFYVSADYFEAWRYTPYLIVGYLFMSLGTFLSTSYTVNKDSKGFLFSGMSGAAINIVLNWIMIPIIGVSGAAFATCISYITVFIYRAFDTRKYLRLDLFNRVYLLEILVVLAMAITLILNPLNCQYVLIIEFLLLLVIARRFILEMLNSVGKILHLHK